MSWFEHLVTWYTAQTVANGVISYPNAALVNPVIAALGAGLLILAALLQASTARQRHFEQTRADLKRRTTENFSKAVDQLGNDKIEIRLGGIYALERISTESPDDYRMVMEIITAFIRENAKWNDSDRRSIGQIECQEGTDFTTPRTDVAAAFGLIGRRLETFRRQEIRKGWIINLSYTDLRLLNFQALNLCGANLSFANLTAAVLRGSVLTDASLTSASLINADLTNATLAGAILNDACLVRARLRASYIVGAELRQANLQGADLTGAFLYGADLTGANLQGACLAGADLRNSNLTGADFTGANVRGASLANSNVRGANFTDADLYNASLGRIDLTITTGLSMDMLATARGDLSTVLPPGLTVPHDWPHRHRGI
jgi:uncharacterized protein YjbI with pentapeptide repeats